MIHLHVQFGGSTIIINDFTKAVRSPKSPGLNRVNDVRAFGRLYLVLGKIEGPAWEVAVINTVTHQCPNVPKYKISMLFPGIPAIWFRPNTFDL